MDIADLASRVVDDRLQLFIFGPGTGESLALRAPPGVWMVVDSCGGVGEYAEYFPVVRLLDTVKEPVEIVVLTHPHADHTVGLNFIVKRFDCRWIGCVSHFIEPRPGHSANNGMQFEGEKVRPALAAIKSEWMIHPNRKWDIRAGEKRKVGAATAQALYPTDSAIAAFKAKSEPNPNDLSTPIAVSWKEARIVLGADLPSKYWPSAEQACDWDLGAHGGLKVAHHASSASQYASLVAAAATPRCWIATPWYNAGQHLPNYADGEGVEVLLEGNPELVVTSLTRESIKIPNPQTRQALEGSWAKVKTKLGKKAVAHRQPDITEAWAVVTFEADGSAHLETGAEAITVVP